MSFEYEDHHSLDQNFARYHRASTILVAIGYTGIAISVLTALFVGIEIVAEQIAPIIGFTTGTVLFIVFPLSLILAVPRRTRGVASIGILVVSYVLAFWTWLTSLIVALALTSIFWAVIGIVLAGVGVVPVAIIGAIVAGKWEIVGLILIGCIAVLLTRYLSLFLIVRSTPRVAYMTAPPHPPRFD